jgi:RHS repeat-associated protein
VAGSQVGCDDYAVSSGTVTLGASPNAFYAQVSAFYTPPPPPPQCPPICDQRAVIRRPPPGFDSPSDADGAPLTGRTALASTAADYVTGSATATWGTSAPIVSLAPYSPGVLTGRFDVVFTHSTPVYFSLGKARAVTIAYNSSTVRPTPVIFLDVSNAPGSSPTGYSIQVRRGGALLKLLNDTNVVYYTPSTGTPVRLAVALDAQVNALGTGWYDVTVTVTALLASGNQSATVSTRLLIVNQTGSSFGKGADLVGVQRVRTMPGSYSVLVTQGDGSATFFENVGDCQTCSTFASPASEPSTLSKIENGAVYRRRYPDGSIVDFSSDGRILRSAGPFGDTTRFVWTDTLLTQIRDPMGKVLTLAYASGRLQSVTDPAGRVTTYAMDGSGRLYRITDPDNVSTNLTYDANDLLTSGVDRAGATVGFTYDPLRRVDTTYAPTMQIYTGATVRPRTTLTAPERTVWQPGTAGTSAATAKVAVRPDTLFAVTVGPTGAVTKSALDRFGRPIKVIGPYGETTTIARDTLGRIGVTTEPNGHITRVSYRSPFWTTESPYMVGQTKDSTTGRTISYGYLNLTNLVASISGDVTRQDFVYHTGANGPVGALDSVFGANRTIIYSVHRPDALGRDTLVTDGGQGRTRVKYDSAWGNVREHIGPRGDTTRYQYDDAGRVDSAWVPGSGLFTYQYDALNRRTLLKNPLGYITLYVYGPTVLNRLIDPKGQIYKFSYNTVGLLVARHDLADTTKADTLKYDEAGNVRLVRTRRGDVITMTYDLGGRLLSRSGPDFPVDSFKYDPADRWMVGWNVNQRDSLTYDQAGRLSATKQAMLGGVAYQLGYTYDNLDRLRTRSAPTGGNVARYVYNGTAGVPDTLCASGACMAIKHAGAQLRDTMIYNPGLSGSWKRLRFYDSTHVVRQDSFNLVGIDTLFGGRWTYDQLGRLSTEDKSSTGFGTKPWYRYDAIGRLIDACNDSSRMIIDINGNPQGMEWRCINEYGGESHPMAGGTPAYAYDSAGNRVDPAANATVGPGNRIVAFRGYTVGYDANGSVISKTGPGAAYTYTWDALGRLIEVRNGGWVIAAYKYDALGRRVAGTAPDGTTERYVYDQHHVVLDVNGSHAAKVEYGYQPGVDRLFAMRRAQSPIWTGVVLTDPVVGTVRGIADLSGGSLRKKYQVTAWGQGTADTGAVTRFRLAGREYDQATKLYYMRARYYDPDLGRYLSEDGTGVSGGMNLYTYAGNDPVDFSDPSGTECYSVYERDVWAIYINDVFDHYEYGPWEYVGIECDDGTGGGGGWVPGGGGGGPGGAPPPLPQPRPSAPGEEQEPPCPEGPTQWPVGAPHRVSSPFGARRKVGTSPHVGMDIDVPSGTGVYPIAAGVVVSARNTTEGWVVEISHGGGYTSVYRHLSAVNGGISFTGDPVDLQDTMGWSGSAGTGPHLHLELYHDGNRVDPGACLPR